MTTTRQALAASFRQFDLDGSGYLSAEELRAVLTSEAGGAPLTTTEAQEIIASFDTNGDHRLSIDEFVRALQDMGVAPPISMKELTNRLLQRLPKRMLKNRPAQLKRSKSGERGDDSVCAICMSKPRGVRLRPCGHASTCVRCTLKMIDIKIRRISCPLCKRSCDRCSIQAAASTATDSGGDGAVPAPALTRMATFDNAPEGEAQSAILLVKMVKMVAAGTADNGLAASAQRILGKWTSVDASNRLLEVAEAGNLEEARRLLVDEMADANRKDDDLGERPMHKIMGLSWVDGDAPRSGLVERSAERWREIDRHVLALATLLRQHGATLEPRSDFGETPLHLAAQSGLSAVVEYLVDEGARLESRDDFGYTPLRIACSYGHLAVAKLLHGKGASLEAKDEEERMPIHAAAESGHQDVVKWIMESPSRRSMDLAEKEDAETPLFLACQNGHLGVATYLHGFGADPHKPGSLGYSCLYAACDNGHLPVAAWLCTLNVAIDSKADDGMTAWHAAMQFGHEDVAKYLVAQGADVRLKTNRRQTGLHLAAGDGCIALVNLMLEAGSVDLDAKDDDGQTAFYCACEGGHMEASRLLRSVGAAINAPSGEGKLPIHCAAESDDSADGALVKWLLSEGAPFDAVDPSNGRQPMHYAAYMDHVPVGRVLKAAGASLDATETNASRKPIHTACDGDSLKFVRWIHSVGDSITCTDDNGDTPYDVARKEGSDDVAKWLRSHAASRSHAAATPPAGDPDGDRRVASLFMAMGLFDSDSDSSLSDNEFDDEAEV